MKSNRPHSKATRECHLSQIAKSAHIERILGNAQKAKDLFIDALTYMDKPKESILEGLGITYQELGQTILAEQTYQQVIESNPSNTKIMLKLASLYLAKNDYHQSIKVAKKIIELDQKNVNALSNIGICWACQENYTEAEEIFEQCIELEPMEKVHYQQLAITYIKNQKPKKAILLLNEYLNSSKKTPEIYALLEKAYLVDSNIDQAIMSIKRAVNLDDENHLYQGELTRLRYIRAEMNTDKQELTKNSLGQNATSFLWQDNKAENLLISFSSNGGPENMLTPVHYNFLKLLEEETEFDKLFIRDNHQNYYLKGLGSVTKDLRSTIKVIKSYSTKKQYKNITAIGVSAGGFAAILYANLLSFNKAIAFNPQTTIDKEQDSILKDNVFANETSALRNTDNQDLFYEKCLNLKNFIPFKTMVDLHYSSDSLNGIDKRHAEYIVHERCRLIEHQCSSHMLAAELKASGKLKEIILDAFK